MYMTLTDSLFIVKEENVNKVVEMLTDGKYGVEVFEKPDGRYVLEPKGRPLDGDMYNIVISRNMRELINEGPVREILFECEPNSYVCLRSDCYDYCLYWNSEHAVITQEWQEQENPFANFMSQLNTRALGIFG